MFAAPSSSFSCAAGDGGLFLRLVLDQAATSSSEGGLLDHRLEVANSLSSFSTLNRSALPLHRHHYNKHGTFSIQAATHVHSLSSPGNCSGYGAYHHKTRGLSVQAATHLLSLSRAGHGGLHHHQHHHQLQQHRLRIQAASSSSVGTCAGHGNLLQQEQTPLCLTLPSTFSCSVCVGNGGSLQQSSLQAHSQQHLSLQEQQERLLRQQQKQEITKKHEAGILESIAEHQASLKNSALASTNSQIEPNAIGYLPPEFDINSRRSVFVGNIHYKVTVEFLREVFSTVGTLASCKLIRKAKSSYGIVEYLDHRAAAVAIATLNGRQLFNLHIKVNWAYSKEEREDKTGHHTIFVGDLGAEITDAALFAFFSIYPSCSDVQVKWDPQSGRSKGFGFASFREREDAERAIKEMTGKMLGSRAIRCDWTTEEGANKGQEATLKKGLKDDPRCTTVFVGNLAREVTEDELRKEFDMLGVGVIENVFIPDEKNFGFVRYSTHEEAALAISAAKGKIILGKLVVCSWGRKRNPSDASSESRSLAPPVLTLQEVLPFEEVKAEG